MGTRTNARQINTIAILMKRTDERTRRREQWVHASARARDSNAKITKLRLFADI